MLIGSAAFGSPAPSVDGFVNDPFWSEKARAWTLFDPAHPDTVARCFIGYDDQFLYFAADVADTNVVGTNRTPKSKAWEDDAIKLLLHTGNSRSNQWTAETVSYTFSATGAVTWARGPLPADANPDVESTWPPPWNSTMNWAVCFKPGTTPNVTGTPDRGYGVEARIPWTELGVRPPFKPGATLGVCILNVCRPELSVAQAKPISSVAAAREITPGNPSLWQQLRMDWYGPLSTRGLVKPLPLWLGSPAQEYAGYRSAETDPQGRWWDRDQWKTRLDRMRSQNLNTLVLRHTNPWTGLLAPASAETRPAASLREAIGTQGWFKPEDFARCRDQFNWILTEAEKSNIRVYLMLADEEPNLVAPASTQPSAATQPGGSATQAGLPDPDAARALASMTRQLFATYPDLAGLAAGRGFNSPDVLEALAEAMPVIPADSVAETAAARPPAELWVWSAGIAPHDVLPVLKRYPHVQLMHPLQGAHWYKPLADSACQRFTREVEQLGGSPASPVASITVGSMRSSLGYLFWADPQWARTLMLDLRNQGHQGFLLDSGRGEHGLAREALFEYAYNAGQRFSPQRWESRLQAYGVGEYAGQLLEAMQHASAIIPEALLLLNEPSSRFMPQFGLLLAHYTQLPSYSANANAAEPVDVRARLLPKLGPTWPDPVWGRVVASIRNEAEGNVPPDSVTPADVAGNISRRVQACNSLLPGLRHIKPQSPEQAAQLNTLLDEIELNIALGDHIANKIQAARGYEQYKARRGRAVDCVQPLQKSVEAWAKVSEISDRLYPQPVTYWQSQPVSAPPWSVDYLQRNYVAAYGKWSDQLRRFERELNYIREVANGPATEATLPLWDHVNAAPEEKRQTRFVLDFEQPDTRCNILAGASVAEGDETRIAGKKSLLVDTRQLPPGRHEVFVTDPGHIPLMSGLKYQISLIYRVMDGGAAGLEPFEIGVRPAVGGPALGDRPYWTAPNGYLGARMLQVPPPAQDGNVVFVATTSPAAILIDSICIAQIVE
jgi:hypothetical protein